MVGHELSLNAGPGLVPRKMEGSTGQGAHALMVFLWLLDFTCLAWPVQLVRLFFKCAILLIR